MIDHLRECSNPFGDDTAAEQILNACFRLIGLRLRTLRSATRRGWSCLISCDTPEIVL